MMDGVEAALDPPVGARGRLTCMVIVAEALLEANLIRDLQACGAVGWTITASRGHGPRNRRVSEVEGGNIRIETLVPDATAERIWRVLETDYFMSYAITAWSYGAEVARMDRYAH